MKLVFILAAAMTLSAAQSFAHDKDKGKKKCGGDCCKKEAKANLKKATVTKKAA